MSRILARRVPSAHGRARPVSESGASGPTGAFRARAGAPRPPGGRRPALPQAVVSDDGPHRPVDRQGQHAREQVAGHLRVPADADVPSAVRVLQGGVHPPAAGALPLADAVVADVARVPPRQRFPREALPQPGVAAQVGVDDRHAPREHPCFGLGPRCRPGLDRTLPGA